MSPEKRGQTVLPKKKFDRLAKMAGCPTKSDLALCTPITLGFCVYREKVIIIDIKLLFKRK